MTYIIPAAASAVYKALKVDPIPLFAAISIGGLASLAPAQSVVTGGIIIAVLMLMDLLTGAASAWYRDEFEGDVLFKRTVAKIVGYSCALVAVYAVIWGAAESTGLSEPTKREGVAGAMMIVLTLLILHEARSVVLNASEMELPVLGAIGRWLKKAERKASKAVEELDS